MSREGILNAAIIFVAIMSMFTMCNSCRTANYQKAMHTEILMKMDSVKKLTERSEEQRKNDFRNVDLSLKETMLEYIMYNGDVNKMSSNVGKLRDEIARMKKNQDINGTQKK